MRVHWRLLVGLCAIAGSACAIGQVSKNVVERLHQAEIEDSIDGPEMKPWHLKMSFQMLDAKGAQTDQGTIEAWWAPGKQRIVVTSTGYNATELKNESGRYRTVGADSLPHAVEALVRGVVHPMPEATDIDRSKPDLVKETLGKVSTECIMLTEEVGLKMQAAPIGMFPTYCMLKDTNRLVVSYDPGAEMVQLSAVGKFLGHTVGTSLILVDGNTVAAKAHVDTLSTSSADVGDFTTLTGLEDANNPPPVIGAGVMAGKLISRPNPIYPDSAKQSHVSGKVVLKAKIGRDGHIRHLRVKSAPDGALALSALAAVRQWVYSPYILNGHPVEVDTEITVNYTFG